jgi:4-amino-4-deoxy-L-arabinose transferase-like glycosyltransferase
MISRVLIFDKLAPLILLLGNLLVVLGTELAHDEAYYWLFSQNLAWGYFDHPPMAAWLIYLTEWLGGELGVRLSYVLCMQATAYLLSKMVPKENQKLVWLGVNIFPLLAYAGVFAIPDGPLVFFSALWLWQLQRSLNKDNYQNAFLLGLITALLFYSKYHGVLFIVGTLLALPHLLFRPTLWLAALVGLIFFAPHVWWQWTHGFATFRYHFLDRPGVSFGLQQPLYYLFIQLFLPGLLLAPLIWKQFYTQISINSFERALKGMTWFVVIFFFISTFNKKLEANWTVAAGIPLLLFVSMGDFLKQNERWIMRLGFVSLAIIFISRLILITPPAWHGFERGHEVHGWKSWAAHVEKQAPNCRLAANSYQIASKLSFYLQRDVPSLNVKSRLNQFEFWDWDKKWNSDEEICWVKQQSKPGLNSINGPDGKNLVLVKGRSLADILIHKKREL